MTSYRKALAFCVFLLSYGYGYPQQAIIRFEKLTNNEGLSSNQVNCIYQDKLGFIWLGTDDGLNRFDGLNFTVYKHSIKNPSSLKDNYIDAIVEDKNGNLIIGTSKGLSVFNWATDKFSSLPFESLPESVTNGNIEKLLLDENNNLWVSVENEGLFRLSLNDQNFDVFRVNHGLSSNNVTAMSIDNGGRVWVIADGRLHYFLYDHFAEIRFPDGLLERSTITKFIQGNGSDFWVGTAKDGLYRIELSGGVSGNELIGSLTRVLEIEAGTNEIQSIYKNSSGVIWVGIEGEGLARIDDASGAVERYTYSPQNINSLSYNSILTIYEDKVGDLWFGTVAGGVSVIHFTKQNFINSSQNAGGIPSISSNDVTRFSEDGEARVWIGTKTGGIDQWDPKYKRYKNYNENNSFLRNNSVEAVLGAKNNTIWLGGWKSGLYQVTPDFDLIGSFDVGNSDLLSDNIFDLLEDREGNIWVGTIGGGLSKVSKEYQITSYLKEGIVTDESPITLALDSGGNILLGGWRGLTKFNPNSETGKRYFFKEDLSGISSNTIQCIWVVNGDSVWIGTDDGLNLFDPGKETFQHFFEEDGLPSNSIKGIVLSNNDLWISTNNGISKLDLRKGTFRNFSPLDGLQGRQFTNNSFLRSSSGEIYFGGVNGVTSFSPENIVLNAEPPTVLLTDLMINNVPLRNMVEPPLTDYAGDITELKLRHHQSYLSFSFIALNFISSEENQYAYMLEGFDKDWVYTSVPSAFYSNIDPGKYTFRVKASNNNGVWNENGIGVEVNIQAPWWDTWWFRTLYISAILGGVYLFFWLRTKRLRLQRLVLKRTVSERTRQLEDRKEELEKTLEDLKKAQTQIVQSEKMASLGVLTAGISHEINNPLQFIRGGKEIIEKELRKVSEYENKLIDRSLESIEEGVHRTEAIIQGLNRFNRTTKEMEVCDLNLIIDNCLLMLNNEYHDRIQINKEYRDNLVVRGNEGELHQVFLNILKNAGQAIEGNGTILIKTSSTEKAKEVEITDSGVGMDDEISSRIIEPFFTTKEPGQGSGLGLAIGYQIIKKHNGSIEFESAPEKGTTVIVKFFE